MNEVEELEDLLETILRGLQDALQNGENLPEDFQTQVAQEITYLTTEIDRVYSQANQPIEQQTPEAPQQRPIQNQEAPSASSQLMWILSGQREDTFLQYLRTYPDPELQALLRNPTQLESTLQQLHQMMPSGRPPVSEQGIPHAELNSSNVYGFKYDPGSQNLMVQFQGNGGSGQGPVYSYDGVPPNVYKAFERGAVPAKTNGQNRWGRWWTGKNPSLGAAFHELIKNGGYPYQKLS